MNATLLANPAPLRRLDQLDYDHGYAALGPAYGSRVTPEALPDAQLLHFNLEAAALVDLDPAEAQSPQFLAILSGNALLPQGDYLSTLYAGHQFGTWVPQLGDGRALLLGQVRNARGELWELQLKGSGHTPYSRFGDGRAVLRSSLREYLAGEALHALGIPTTRALCLIGSSEPVQRESVEHAALICRMAPSHIRFGHFEVFYYRQQFDLLRRLADFVIERFHPGLAPAEDRYAAWLREVTARTARLMAQWQSFGFMHGVMNTDNMSILGLTLDYGPYGFMDGFDARHICNHSDEGGRYAYDQQPGIGGWNVSRLIQATLPLLHEDPQRAVDIGSAILDGYAPTYSSEVVRRWRAKFGLVEAREGDEELINRFLTLLHRGHSDFTRSFRHLARVRAGDDGPALGVREEIHELELFDAWVQDYRARLRAEQSDDLTRAAAMNAVNPRYVLRNYLAQNCIEKVENGELGEIERLLGVLRRPFDEQPTFDRYAAEPPVEARHIEVSCSS